MGKSTIVGRVGSLAVALGLGAGLMATPWAVSAKPPDSGSQGNSASGSNDDKSHAQKGTASSTDDGAGSAVTTADGAGSAATAGDGAGSAVTAGDSDTSPASANNTARVTGDASDAGPVGADDNSATDLAPPKPLKGNSSGSVSINTGDGTLSGEESGVSSQFGKYSLSLAGQSTNSGGVVSSSGRMTLVTANGDVVTGSFTLSGPAHSDLTAVVTIDGGTGRFANATGTMTVICSPSGPPSQDGLVLVIKNDCITEGGISY